MILLNELEEAKNILEKKDINNNPKACINLLIRYFVNNEGLDKEQTLQRVDGFLRNSFRKYNFSKWVDYLKKQIKAAKKYPLSEIQSVPITKIELNTIEQLHNIRFEKVAFTLLCFAKLYNLKNEKNNGWVNQELKTIFKHARVTIKAVEQCLLIAQIRDAGLIHYSSGVDNTNIKVNFIDDSNENVVLNVSDFRELGYEYMLWKGENFFRCSECGILAKQNKKGNRKYCSSCSKYNKIEEKVIHCIDCGCEVEINGVVKNKKRCDKCQEEANLERKRKWWNSHN